MFNLFSLFFNPLTCDAPEAWQIGFQDGAFWLGSILTLFLSVRYFKHTNCRKNTKFIASLALLFLVAIRSYIYCQSTNLILSSTDCMCVFSNNNCFNDTQNIIFLSMTAIVPWGAAPFGSAVGMRRFRNVVRNMYPLTPFYEGVMVGILLSDSSVMRGSTLARNWRINFEQSFTRNFSYFMHVFQLLLPFTRSLPSFRTRPAREGTTFGITHGLTLITMALPCITQLAKQFFNPGSTVKVVPADIYNLLSPVALAHWIMGDGEAKESGLRLCTDSVTIPDMVTLMNVLITRYGIDCRIHRKREGQYRIFIPESELGKLRSLVLPYMIPQMYYKIGIRP